MTNNNNKKLQNLQGKTIQVPNQKKVVENRIYKQGSFAMPVVGNLVTRYNIDTKKYKGLDYTITLQSIEGFTVNRAKASCGCTNPIVAEDGKSLSVKTNLAVGTGSKSVTITIFYKEDKEESKNEVARKAQITFINKAE